LAMRSRHRRPRPLTSLARSMPSLLARPGPMGS
jgi:hypothetical protein